MPIKQQTLNKLENFFYSGHSLENDEYSLKQSYVLFNSLLVILVVLKVLSTIIYLWMENYFLTFLSILTVVAALVTIFLLRIIPKGQYTKLASIAFIVFALLLTIAYITNYTIYPLASWFLVYALAVGYILGFRTVIYSYIWFALLIVCMIFYGEVKGAFLEKMLHELYIMFLGVFVIFVHQARFIDKVVETISLKQSVKEGVKEQMQLLIYEKNLLEFQMHFNILTGLNNRLKFHKDIDFAVMQYTQKQQHFSICYIDLDNFKKINHSYGHLIGDKVLKTIAKRIYKTVKHPNKVYHIGGDEFALIVFHENGDKEALETLAKEILANTSKVIVESGDNIFLSTSIGICTFDPKRMDRSELTEFASKAMNEVKSRGKGDYCFGEHNLEQLDKAKIESNLRQQLNDNSVNLLFQPQVSFDINKIHGVEILLTLDESEMSKSSLISLLELGENGRMISLLDYYILEKSMYTVVMLHEKFMIDFKFSINLSSATIERRDFLEKIESIQIKTGCNPAWISLELTESYLMQNIDKMGEKLNTLNQKGYEVILDDFGKGYSSLAYLKQLPIKKIKIDKFFIDELSYENKDSFIVESIINMAHKLGYETIAEGVETQKQQKVLLTYGCSIFQGFYFYKPMLLKEFKALLANVTT